MVYLSKADRRRLAEIIEIFAGELIELMAYRVAETAEAVEAMNPREDVASRMARCHRTTNEWLWEMSCILLIPIKQVGDRETHAEERTTLEEAPEEDDEATGS